MLTQILCLLRDGFLPIYDEGVTIMPDTMTLPEKLRSAARSPDSWDLPGLLADAADALEDAGPEDDDDEDDQLSNMDNCRREVVPGWTLEELLAREG